MCILPDRRKEWAGLGVCGRKELTGGHLSLLMMRGHFWNYEGRGIYRTWVCSQKELPWPWNLNLTKVSIQELLTLELEEGKISYFLY